MREDDDEYLTGLLASLGDRAPDPMSSVERAITDGRARRRRRRQRVSVSGAVAAVAALAVAVAVMVPRGGSAPVPASLPSVAPSPSPTMPAAPAACRAGLLPEPPGVTDTQVVAADPTGRYQAGYAWRGAGWTVVLWDQGKLETVTTVPGKRPTVAGVNSAGVVTGYTVPRDPQSPTESSIWTLAAGKLSYLPSPPGGTAMTQFRAEGINGAGDVVGVGYELNPKEPDTMSEHLIVWPADDPAEPRTLASPAGTTPAPTAVPDLASIDDQGRVYATLTVSDGKPGLLRSVPYVWSPAGVAAKLPVPDGFVGRSAVRGDQLLGNLKASGTLAYGSLDLGTGQLLRYPDSVVATSVNRWGWAIGAVDKQTPVAVFAGSVVKLPVPVGGGAGYAQAYTISDTGATIGGDVTLAGQRHAVLWTCR
ncbi:hypothetical protein [Rugosimonospora africana]|uniref:Uncharacterized protein n=1 Tax=Rugosimonospora africana TaxID=556532 RepID=A0A8J3VRC8_9ACTN|nr:hypothetical protein [Rugosimonospora africana]GIH15401.1 hypothetical protein Raf01_35730 [Rugosimonospora africana]